MKEALYRRWLLAILLLVFAFNFVDRLALGIALQDIKDDLGLSDTQLGVLSGIAFALFYSLMGVPIARWADHGNRVTIISITTAVWSVMVAACGLATGFVQLLLTRIGVAIGEAGCLPPAHSLIADNFSRAERPRAVSIYMLGAPLSVVLGYFVAGWINEIYGWRAMFVMLALPGVVLAILVRLTVREPRGRNPVRPASQPRFAEVCRTLWANTTFRQLLFCFSVTAFFGSGMLQWQPAFFVRSYGLQSGELGTWFAGIGASVGLLGTYLGGELAARHARHNERLQLTAIATVHVALAFIWSGLYLSGTHYLAFALMALASFLSTAANGPLFATIQTLVPDRMRAVSIALIYLAANLIGMGLGPLVVGALSDAFEPWAGQESLRYALLALCPGCLWSAWHLWRASRTVAHDLASAAVPSPG
jgi:MFS family permease